MNTGRPLALGAALPPAPVALAAMVLGLLGYGVSLVPFVLALRWLATALMALGVWLHLTERHEHEPLGHTHSHTHDAHHQHAHAFAWEKLAGPTATGMNMHRCVTVTRISPTSTTGTGIDDRVAPANSQYPDCLTRSFFYPLIYQTVK